MNAYKVMRLVCCTDCVLQRNFEPIEICESFAVCANDDSSISVPKYNPSVT